MREIPLGEILSLERDEVRLLPAETYVTAGILSYGRGLFERPPVLGSETSYRSYFRLHSGQFVYSKLFAWEGALAVVDDQFDNLFVSQEFPTFSIDRTAAEPAYMRLLCEWPSLWEAVRGGQTGMGGRRKRVHPEFLLTIPIPLPDLASQSRIVDLLAALDATLRSARTCAGAAELALLRMLDRQAGGDDTRTLGDLASMSSGPSWKSDQETPFAVPGALPVLAITNTKPDGRIDLTERRYVAGLPESVRQLTDHSIIMIRTNGNRDRIGNVYRSTPDVVGCAVSAFQINLEPETSDDAAYVYWRLRSPEIQASITSAASGSTGLGNVAVGWLRELPLSWPDAAQRKAYVGLAEALDGVKRKAEDEASSLSRLRGALLDELLSGRGAIDSAYDTLLKSA